jgi:hypothetical protein
MLCYAMLCYAMLCYAMLCYAMLCYAMLCYAMLCYAMQCYATLCYATLEWRNAWVICSLYQAEKMAADLHIVLECGQSIAGDEILAGKLVSPIILEPQRMQLLQNLQRWGWPMGGMFLLHTWYVVYSPIHPKN